MWYIWNRIALYHTLKLCNKWDSHRVKRYITLKKLRIFFFLVIFMENETLTLQIYHIIKVYLCLYLCCKCTYCLLTEELSSGHWGSGIQGYEYQHTGWADSRGFLWHSDLAKVQVTAFEVLSSPVFLMMYFHKLKYYC